MLTLGLVREVFKKIISWVVYTLNLTYTVDVKSKYIKIF